MCKTYPGKRCASHTRAALKKAAEEVERCKQVAEDASAVYDALAFDPGADRSALLAAKMQMEHALEELREAELVLEDARLQHESTPTGRKELEARIEAATTETERQRLQERLDNALELSDAQGRGAELQRAADEKMLRLAEDEENTEAYEDLRAIEDDLNSQKLALDELSEQLSTSVHIIKAASKRNAVARRAFSEEAAKMQDVINDIKTHLVQAYEESGLSKDAAESYATDTLTNLGRRSGFIGPDSFTDRVTLYSNDLKVKTKGEGHPDALATRSAAERLEQDPHFNALKDVYSARLGRYNDSYEEARAAGLAVAMATREASTVTRKYGQQRDSYEAALREYQESVAHYVSSEQLGAEYYRVNPANFRKSLYSSPRGGTNGFVLFAHEDYTPMWVRVQRVGEDHRGGYLLLENGQKVPQQGLSAQSLLLVRPDEGAQKVFA